MGDSRERARRLARAVEDLRELRKRAPGLLGQPASERLLPGHYPEITALLARPDARIARRLEAVERALEDLVLELHAASAADPRVVELDDPLVALPPASNGGPPPENGGRPTIELHDPFGLLGEPNGCG
jgi:glyoxylase-like metal-dependent hydrolase (beta-lactamase superfamily II)